MYRATLAEVLPDDTLNGHVASRSEEYVALRMRHRPHRA